MKVKDLQTKEFKQHLLKQLLIYRQMLYNRHKTFITQFYKDTTLSSKELDKINDRICETTNIIMEIRKEIRREKINTQSHP